MTPIAWEVEVSEHPASRKQGSSIPSLEGIELQPPTDCTDDLPLDAMLRGGAQSSKRQAPTTTFVHSQPRTSHKLRVFHDDQPYLALPNPTSSSTLQSLLPFPPTSPLLKRSRFIFNRARFTYPLISLKSRLGRRLQPLWISKATEGPACSPLIWVFLYFALNLSLTLYNKYVLNHFPFPYTLTALHALCGTVGTFVMLHLGLTSDSPIPNLSFKEAAVLVLFSMLYTINIIVSNASLKLVTVPFHQVIRGSSPLFTIALGAIIFRKGCSRAKLVSLLPVIAGVGFATYGDYYFTLFGFLITIFGTFLAALKTILTNLFLRTPSPVALNVSAEKNDIGLSPQQKKVPAIFRYFNQSDSQHRLTIATPRFNLSLPILSLTPLQLLYLMSPLAFTQTTIIAHLTGELELVNRHLSNPSRLSGSSLMGDGLEFLGIGGQSWWLIMNGMMAFALNVVSFNSNKRIGPLGMSVAANVKQVLTILCAVGMFNLTITATNGVGITLTLIGGAWYAYVEIQEKKQIKRSG